MKKEYRHIFEPFTVRRMTLKNRIMMTPMGTNYGEQSGEMSFLHINYYEQRAKGGTGLIMVENASVDSPEGSNGTTQLRTAGQGRCSLPARSMKPSPRTPTMPAGRVSPAWSTSSAASWGLVSSKPFGATATNSSSQAPHQNKTSAQRIFFEVTPKS